MKIIIEIRNGATLERIAQFGINLKTKIAEFDDVIEEVKREW